MTSTLASEMVTLLAFIVDARALSSIRIVKIMHENLNEVFEGRMKLDFVLYFVFAE